MKDVAVALYYSKQCKYSVHALISAIDTEVSNVDLFLISENENFFFKLFSIAKAYRKVIVGFSLLTTFLHKILWLITYLSKNKGNNVIIVAGGPHATGDPVGTLNLGFDVVFLGESEKTFTQFISEIADKGDPFSIPGIAYRENGEYFFNGRAKPIPLDTYPPFPYWRRMFNPIELTRGCPFQCGYCQTPFIHGFIPRHRSISNVLKYAEIFWKHGLRDLRFIIPNALAYGSVDGLKPNVNSLVELLDSLSLLKRRYGGRVFLGSFPSEIRPEFLTFDLAKLLKKHVDNRKIIIGAQSGSERILRILRRGHSVGDVVSAVEAAVKAGFNVDVDFIFGFPNETEEDVEKSIKLMEKLVKLGVRIHAHTFLPLPGSPLENAPPGKIPYKIKKFIMKIYGSGKVYGDWVKQEKLAKIIDEMRRKGMIRVRERWKLKLKKGYGLSLIRV